MTQASLRIRLVRILLLIFLCSLCSACVVLPVRVQTKTRTAEVGGNELKRKVDLSFLQVGKTTRDEVESSLAWVATGIKDERSFLARWAESNLGVAWAAGGGGAGAAGWDRYWKMHNLMIYFDEQGVVRQIAQIPNEQLFQALMERILMDPGHPIDFSTAIEVPVGYVHGGQILPGKLSLNRNGFAFVLEPDRMTQQQNEAYPKLRKFEFQMSPGNIHNIRRMSKISRRYRKVEENRPQFLAVTIEFRNSVAAGKRMDVQIDLPETLTLMRFVAQMQPGLFSATHSIAQRQPASPQGDSTAMGTAVHQQKVLVFVQRTNAHFKLSTAEVFRSILSDLLNYLKTKNVAIAVDEFGRDHAEAVTPMDTVFAIASDAKASSLLYVVVDRPLTKWLKITVQSFDRNRKELWKKEISAGGGLSGAHALEVCTTKLHAQLDQHLGQDGLPILTITGKNAEDKQ